MRHPKLRKGIRVKDKVTIPKLRAAKQHGRKLAMLTAYDYPTARIIDEAGIDIVLVGDSLGNVLLGYENTLPVTMEDMLHHLRAAAKAVKRALVMADMPFLAFQINEDEALRNAGRLIQAGAEAVKIEGTKDIKGIKDIIAAGIPVMGHLGYTPQSINETGGPRVKGHRVKEERELIADAKKLEKAGVFAIVLELVSAAAAKKVQKAVKIPVIGIGAGKDCDGQVLVLHDLIGLSPGKKFKFVKQYAKVGADIKRAVADYIMDVKLGRFPGKEQSF